MKIQTVNSIHDLRQIQQPAIVRFGKVTDKRIIEITKQICKLFQVTQKEIRSKRRLRVYSYPRGAAMWWIRKQTINDDDNKITLSDIEGYFNRKHPDCLHWVRQFENVEERFNSELWAIKQKVISELN